MTDQDWEQVGDKLGNQDWHAQTQQVQAKEEEKSESATQASSVVDTSTEVSSSGRPVYTGDKGLINLTMERDTPIEKKPVQTLSYGSRVRIAKIHEDPEQFMDHIIQVCGWARTTREQGKHFFFIIINDGSCASDLQIVVDSTMPNYEDIITCKVGASFKIKGKLIKSQGGGQLFEVQVCQPELHDVHIFGKCDNAVYPLSKKKHSEEFLREIAHLRPRAKLMSSVTRVRNNLAYATHKFFQERGFQYIHTPILTASDCEGAGEMFQVTTTLPPPDAPVVKNLPLVSYEGQQEEEKAKQAALEEAKKKGGQKQQKGQAPEGEMSKTQLKKLEKKKRDAAKKAGVELPTENVAEETPVVKEEAKQEEVKAAEKVMIPLEERTMNYKKDFFEKPTFLTVSGQLSVENYCCAMGDVYTFGPTFRAENSHTSRHLAEFWMIEPEIAFATLSDDIDLAEDYLKYCLRYVLANNKDDVDYFNQWVDKGLKERLEQVESAVFKRITYTDCIAILEENVKAKVVKFDVLPKWGFDMGSEHERWLTEKHFKAPIVVYDYPKSFKAFYMKQNPDGKTVQAMDLLVPEIGELIGGSVREENLEKLEAAILEKGLELAPYWWYRELRQYGTQPHAGFGLGFERLVMMCTGVKNIRDVIPFPRYPKNAEF